MKILLLLAVSFNLFAAKLQNEDFKTEAQLIAAGSDKSALLSDSKIYIKSNSINETLKDAIEGDMIGGGGPGALNIVTKTTTYSMSSTDDVIVVDTSGGAFTTTLVPCASNNGKRITFIKATSDLNKATVLRSGSDTIEHTSSKTSVGLFTEGESWVLICDAATNSWKVESHYAETRFISYGAITIGATTTAPVKGTIVVDNVSCKRTKGRGICWYKYEHSSAGTANTGHYLYSTPTGWNIDHAFDTDTASNNAAQSSLQKAILKSTGHISNTSQRGHLHAFAYDANTFRMAGVVAFTDYGMVRSASVYPMSATNYAFGLIIDYKVSGWDE